MTAGFKPSPQILALFEAGELEQGLAVALELLNEARRQGNDPQGVLQHLEEVASLSFCLEQFDNAIDSRQELLARHSLLNGNQPSPDVAKDLSRLGWYYQSAKNWNLAEEYLLRGIQTVKQLPPEERVQSPPLWIIRCDAAWGQKDHSLALAHILEAWRMHIRYTRCSWDDAIAFHVRYASLLQELGQWSKADKSCGIALQLANQPDLPLRCNLVVSWVHHLRGDLSWHDKDLLGALAAFQRGAELLKLAPRRYPFAEARAARRLAAAIVKVQAQLIA